jgi:Zn-dependent alcohol dehydrogenase
MEDELSIIPGLIMLKQLEIIGSSSAMISHYYKAIQFIKNKRHKYSFSDIVTGKYSLHQINEARESTMAGNEIKPVIIP